VNCWRSAALIRPLLKSAISSVFSCSSMSSELPIRTKASAWVTTGALFCWRIAASRTWSAAWTVALYVAKARDLGMIWAAICERRLGRPAASRRRAAMACFSTGDALFRVVPESRARRRAATAALVRVSWSSSLARFAPVGADRYTIASVRSLSSWARKAPVGSPVAFFTVLALARLTASLAVVLTAKA
jgi:hypothetical protein